MLIIKDTSSLPKEMTPESLPEELPPQIWNNWPSSTDSMAFGMPDTTTSEIDWVSSVLVPIHHSFIN